MTDNAHVKYVIMTDNTYVLKKRLFILKNQRQTYYHLVLAKKYRKDHHLIAKNFFYS